MNDGAGAGRRLILLSCLIVFCVIIPSGIRAIWEGVAPEQAYLKSFNPDSFDYFGRSIDIDGNTVVIGAPWEDSDGNGPTNNAMQDAGAVYVFVNNGTTWTQQAYLKASNPDPNDNFGHSVAISGNTLVVGAYGEDSGGTDQTSNALSEAGAAYVFVRNGTTWTQQAYLKASNVGFEDRFGYSVDTDGERIIVGASQEASNGSTSSDNSMPRAGAAYVFRRDNQLWQQTAYLKSFYADPFDYFGASVAIDGETVVIGMYGEASTNLDPENDDALNAGAAYVFFNNGASWLHQGYLKAPNSDGEDYFGVSVDISGNTIVIGAYGEDSGSSNPNDNTVSRAGAAYIFQRTGTSWYNQAYLKPAITGVNDEFGFSVTIAGNIVLVGAPREDSATNDPLDNNASNAGAVYGFERTANVWNQRTYLKAPNLDAGDLFGYSVAFAESLLLIGAPGEASDGSGSANNGATSAGAAYISLAEISVTAQVYLPFMRK